MRTNRTCQVRRSSWAVRGAVLLPLVFACSMMAQTDVFESGRWWNPAADDVRERGKVSELVSRKKIYVLTSFTDSRTISEPSPTHTGDVHRLVLDAIAMHKDFQVVPVPTQADFAIRVRTTATTESGDRPPNFSLALDPSTAIAVEVMVLIPGSKQPDGSIRPRVVWESSVVNAQVEAQSAARSTVDGFLWELSRLKKKAAAKSR